jgi:hypothetical protein
MKIVIGGSMSFAKEQIEAKTFLEKRGHFIQLTENIEEYSNSPSIKQSFDEELKISLEHDIMRSFFRKIEENDAFLVMNYKKKDVDGYLGTSVLMELAIAYFLNKKIYLLNEIDKSQPYSLEVAIINPTILNGDLELIQ